MESHSGLEQPRRVSVVIVTRNRPQMVQACLEHLGQQTHAPDEIIVIDSSTTEETQSVLDAYSFVQRKRIIGQANNRPQAKNAGITMATGDIVAFLDDDSMAAPDWLENLLIPYANSTVGGVGGRIIDTLEEARVNQFDQRVGILLRNGYTTTNYFLNPDNIVEVDHLRGCNMSFRRNALIRIGGFDSRFIGSNVGEEPDVCLGVKALGLRIIFQPAALVNHLAAPREDLLRTLGREEAQLFQPAPVLWSAHNRAYLLTKHFGPNIESLRHLLGGYSLLFLRLFLHDPCYARLRALALYELGAWWGVLDGLRGHARVSANRLGNR